MPVGFSIAKAVSAPKKAGIPAGAYDSEVVSVAYAPEYVEGEAIEVRYKLTAADGSEYPYKEIFFNDLKNPRSQEFFDYLEEIGVSIDAIDEFVGAKEEMVLKRSTKGRYMTIESREFIAFEGKQ